MKLIVIFSALMAFPCSGLEMLEPEATTDLTHTLANILGAELTTHVSLGDLELKPEDLYVLPKPPNVELCMSALEGIPLTRQPAPFDSGIEKFDITGYQVAQIKIAQSKPTVPTELKIPKTEKYLSRGLNASQVEHLPPQYQSLIYILPIGFINLILQPLSLFGLKYSKTQPYVKKTLPIAMFYMMMNILLILFINILPTPSLIAVPLSLFGGVVGALFALRSLESIPIYRDASLFIPSIRQMLKEPLGWVACIKSFALIIANFVYIALSSFCSVRFGIVGLVTSNIVLAGMLYILWLSLATIAIFFVLTDERCDPRKAQNLVMAMCCAYVFVASSAFIFNVISTFFHSSQFIALDPVSFFQVSNPFEYNTPTICMLAVFIILWTIGTYLHNNMDEKSGAVRSLSTLSLSTMSDASKALTAFELE